MKTPRILTIGSATQDIFLTYEDADIQHLHSTTHEQRSITLQEGSKIEVSDISYNVGGGALNAATSFKKLGCVVTACCKIGTDAAGEKVREYLRRKDISVALARSGTHDTGTSIIMPTPSGDHIIFAYRGANTELVFEEIAWEFTNKDVAYITSLSGNAAHLLPDIVEQARYDNVPLIACNPGMSQLKKDIAPLWDALAHIDILILNASEAQHFLYTLTHDEEIYARLYNQEVSPAQHNAPALMSNFLLLREKNLPITAYFKEILAHGPKIVVVTNGSEGVYVATHDQMLFHPSIPTKTINTVGAGDAFGSCFVASILAENSLEIALYKGLINSSSVLHYQNAQDGLLTQQELDQKLSAFNPELISMSWS